MLLLLAVLQAFILSEAESGIFKDKDTVLKRIEEGSKKAPSLKRLRVGIYCGKGVSVGHLWHACPLENLKITIVFFTEQDIKSLKNMDVICFPSGGGYARYIKKSDQEYLKKIIHDQGVGYLGTCGGNVFGNDMELLDAKLIKSGNRYPYALQINGFPSIKVVRKNHPAMLNEHEIIYPFYYSGQVFDNTYGPDVTVLARYKDFNNCFYFKGGKYKAKPGEIMIDRPCIITGRYGKGRVILSGPHPEIGEKELFVNWIYFLSKGKILTQQGKNDPAYSGGLNQAWNQSLLTSLNSNIEKFYNLIKPFAAQIRPHHEQVPKKGGSTIGLSVLTIIMGTCNRLESIKNSIDDINRELGDDIIQMAGIKYDELETNIIAAESSFIKLGDQLEETIKMIKNKREEPLNKTGSTSMKKSFYPGCYYTLVEKIKIINLRFVKLDYSLKKHIHEN